MQSNGAFAAIGDADLAGMVSEDLLISGWVAN
jgi:hypothetical protein